MGHWRVFTQREHNRETMEPSLVYKQNCTAHSQPAVNIGIHIGHVVKNCAKFFAQYYYCYYYYYYCFTVATQICGGMNVGGDGGRMKIVVA